MANPSCEALLVSTSWNTASDDLASQPTRTLVKYFCENTLKSDDVSKLYCTVLDVQVREDQKKDAESVRVTLIPATRSKWSDPVVDPPAPNWLLNHDKYYPGLKDLQYIKHVVSFSSTTKNLAAAIHEDLFSQARLHDVSVPTSPGVVFAFDAWSRDACGLTGYHRAIIQDFIARKAESGEYLQAYSTVVDVELSADQTNDAKKCGVTLIKAQRKKEVDEMPKLEWLINHESHFPHLGNLENIKYVVGYAPKTGWAAIYIKQKLFPDAKLVLINHACQEQNCLLVKDEFSELEQKMLQMASNADLLFSIGPHLHGHFKNAYRAVIQGRKLYDIPHKEILPKPRQQYFDIERPESDIEIDGPNILTYGQLNTEEALKRCGSIAASIGSAAKNYKTLGKKPLEWKIHGVSEQAYKSTKNFLLKKLKSSHVMPKPCKQQTADTLLQSLQQSDVCVPPSCYNDYSFEGLEAMATGLPTTVQDDSHIAAMIERHFDKHKDYCVVRNETEELTSKIIQSLKKNNIAVEQANLLRKDFAESKAVTESLVTFAALLTEDGEKTKKNKSEDVTGGAETTQTRAMQPGIPVVDGIENAEITAVQPGRSGTVDKETTQTRAVQSVQSGMSVLEGMENAEITAVQSGRSGTPDEETTDTRAVLSGMSVTDTTTVFQLGISETEDMEMINTRTVQPVSVTEAMDNYKVQPVMSVTEDIENSETAQVYLPDPVTKGVKTTQTRAVQHFLSVTESVKTSETKTVHSGIPDVKDKEISKPPALQKRMVKTKETGTENSDNITEFQMTGNGHSSCLPAKSHLPSSRHQRKRKGEGNSNKDIQSKIMKEEQRKSKEQMLMDFEMPGKDESEIFENKIQRMERVGTNPGTPPTPLYMATGSGNDSSDLEVHVKLNEKTYKQHMKDLDEQVQTRRVTEKKKKLKAAWERCQAELHKNTDGVLSDENSQRTIGHICEQNLGKVTLKSKSKKSLAILLDLPTLYNLYRLECTCLSGSFPDSFEPLLITDKMREAACKVGLQLKLKATYDQARFDELELFFMNRDGGGLKPVKVYDNVIEGKDAEEIHTDDEDTDQKSDTTVTEGVADRSPTEHRQSIKDIQSKLEMERATLESQLKETKEEKATLEERCKELTQKLESTEQSLVSQRMDTSVKQKTLQSELEEKKKLIKELEDKVEQSKLKKSGEKGDGGGLKPVKVFDDVIEGKDAEEIHIHDDDTDQKSDSMITEGVDSISQGETPTFMPQQPPQHQHEMSAGHMMQASAATGSTSPVVYSQAQQMPYLTDQSHTQGSITDQMIPQPVQNQSKIQNTQKPQMYRSPLQEYLTSPHLQGQIPIPQEIQASTTQVYDPTIMPQQPPQHHHEMSTGHMMQASAATGPPTSPVVYSQAQLMPYQTNQSHTQGTIMGQMRPQHMQYQPNIQFTPKPQMNRSPQQGHLTSPQHQRQNPLPQEIQTSATQVYDPTLMPQRPSQHHHEMSTGHMMQASAATGPPTTPVGYYQAQQMPYPIAQPRSQGSIMGQMIPQHIQYQRDIQSTQKPPMYRQIAPPQGHLTSPQHQWQNPFPPEIETSATQVYDDWSVTLVSGQHQGRGQKFKLPCGLAFHRDKLVVCDYGNNIVQILNKDYTCDKVIGSFDGQFAKPFRPTRVAISRFNHYFILDGENKQIVVCDENGKIIQIITLPENIDGVLDIALMDDFVLVTLSLTSLDITRPEDRDDRLVKYTQSGKYVKDVGGQTSVQTKFYYPDSVAVNSKNVIMVYDYGNECIKCFDSDLNFLHQFRQSQLQIPRTGSEIEGGGSIAVDEDDNVYVCGSVIVKSTGDVIKEFIVKYGCDGKFICDLFKGHVSLPLRIAVMGDKIGVVEFGSDQIKVFSK